MLVVWNQIYCITLIWKDLYSYIFLFSSPKKSLLILIHSLTSNWLESLEMLNLQKFVSNTAVCYQAQHYFVGCVSYLQWLFSVLASQYDVKSTEGEKTAWSTIVLLKCSHVSSRWSQCERPQECTSILPFSRRNNSHWRNTRRWQKINEAITSVEEALCRLGALAEFTCESITGLFYNFTAVLVDMCLWL